MGLAAHISTYRKRHKPDTLCTVNVVPKKNRRNIFEVLHVISLISSLQKENLPEDLKKPCVTPLFKKGNPEDPLIYRPISLISASSKIFEKAFSSQITSCLERAQLLFFSQFRYRKQLTLS